MNLLLLWGVVPTLHHTWNKYLAQKSHNFTPTTTMNNINMELLLSFYDRELVHLPNAAASHTPVDSVVNSTTTENTVQLVNGVYFYQLTIKKSTMTITTTTARFLIEFTIRHRNQTLS
jgi:hypothetical protein